MNGILAAFDFANIISMVTQNILPLILGGGLVAFPVNAPKTPYTPLIQALLTKIGLIKPAAPTTPTPDTNPLLTLLVPFIQKLAIKPPVTDTPSPPDLTTLLKNPNEAIAWIAKLLESPEQTVKPHIENPTISPVEVRWEHFAGCFQAMVDLYPDFDIYAVSENGNTVVKKTERIKVVK